MEASTAAMNDSAIHRIPSLTPSKMDSDSNSGSESRNQRALQLSSENKDFDYSIHEPARVGSLSSFSKFKQATQFNISAFIMGVQKYEWKELIPTQKQLLDFVFKCETILIRSSISLVSRYTLIIISFVLHILLAALFAWIIGSYNVLYNVISTFALSSMFIIIMNTQFAFYIFNNHQVIFFLYESAPSIYTLPIQMHIRNAHLLLYVRAV